MTSSTDHINFEALAELKDIMEDQFDILIDTFVADSEAKIALLANIIADADAEALRKTAHSLKGSSSNVCALQLSELARQLEQIGKQGSTEGALDIYQAIKQEFAAVIKILKNDT